MLDSSKFKYIFELDAGYLNSVCCYYSEGRNFVVFVQYGLDKERIPV